MNYGVELLMEQFLLSVQTTHLILKKKKSGNIWSMPAGMCGVETIVPLMLNAVNEGKLSILKFAKLLSSNPAKNFDIFPKKGSLMVGTDADITIIDMDIDWTIKKE